MAMSPLETTQVPRGLPGELNTFVGREAELVEVSRLLTRARLVSITGTGGSGKTRFAIRLAARVAHQYADGVIYMELTPVTADAMVAQAVASRVGVTEHDGGSVSEAVRQWFSTKPVLLVLDNCEHVVNGCAELVRTLLQSCPRLQVLTTTREPLGIDGEVTWLIPPLSLPGSGDISVGAAGSYEAIQLFLDRASLVQPGFELFDSNLDAVVGVCRQLEGVPLAIELAAASLRALSLEQIRTRLEQRLGLLETNSRTAPARHRTLRAAIVWSYQLLSSAEREVFAGLSTFVGGWTLEAAQMVCASETLDASAVLDVLTHLIDKSLIHVVRFPNGSVRYRLLETLREFAGERLEEMGADAVRHMHAIYFVAFAEQVTRSLPGPDQGRLLDQLEREQANFVAALEWFIAHGEAELGLRLGVALARFWEIRGHAIEGLGYLTALNAQGAGVPRMLRARAIQSIGRLESGKNDVVAAAAHFSDSLRLFRELSDWPGIVSALGGLAVCAHRRGDRARALEHYDQALAAARQSANSRLIATTLLNRSALDLTVDDFGAGARDLEEAAERFRALGIADGAAAATARLAARAWRRGDYSAGLSMLDESIGTFRELGYKPWLAFALQILGVVLRDTGKLAEARAVYEEEVEIANELGSPLRLADAWFHLGEVMADTGHRLGGRAFVERALATYHSQTSTWQESWGIMAAAACLGRMDGEDGDPVRCTAVRVCWRDARFVGYAGRSGQALELSPNGCGLAGGHGPRRL
jgi:predicted ATPase